MNINECSTKCTFIYIVMPDTSRSGVISNGPPLGPPTGLWGFDGVKYTVKRSTVPVVCCLIGFHSFLQKPECQIVSIQRGWLIDSNGEKFNKACSIVVIGTIELNWSELNHRNFMNCTGNRNCALNICTPINCCLVQVDPVALFGHVWSTFGRLESLSYEINLARFGCWGYHLSRIYLIAILTNLFQISLEFSGLKTWPFTRQRGGVVPSPVESGGLTDALEMEILEVGRLRWMTLRTSGYKECWTRDIFS